MIAVGEIRTIIFFDLQGKLQEKNKNDHFLLHYWG